MSIHVVGGVQLFGRFLCCLISFCLLCNSLLVLAHAALLPPRPRIIASAAAAVRSARNRDNEMSDRRQKEWRSKLAKNSETIGKIALSGGMAGGITVASLQPIDTIKTMRQLDPNIRTVYDALRKFKEIGFIQAYSGLLPAVLGSVPSSAVYFGAYETAKLYLRSMFSSTPRQYIHMLAACSGNVLSSLIFVPKDLIKTRMQSLRTTSMSKVSFRAVVSDIYRRDGIFGFYANLRVVLAKNIPSAVIRFTLYEELKLFINSGVTRAPAHIYLMAGSIASACSSACNTPFDVLKTRIAAGSIDKSTPIIKGIREIYRNEGLNGMYAGVCPRILWSALFGGIGLTSFEMCKSFLNVSDVDYL